MKTFTIIGGVDGVGKTSIAGILQTEVKDIGKIIDENEARYICGDTVKADEITITSISESINKGICFTLKTTLSSRNAVIAAKNALEQGYYVRCYYVGLNTIEESINRIKNRVSKGGHDVSADIIEWNFNTRFADISELIPYCNEVVFYDNENGFCAVATYTEGKFRLLEENTPEWICAFARTLIDI